MSVTGRKQQLRRQALERRARRSEAERSAAGRALAAVGSAEWPAVSRLAAFWSFGTEPPTLPLLSGLAANRSEVLLPRIVGERLEWVAYAGPARCRRGALGGPEPTGPAVPAALESVELLVVPALAVDRRGNRLGRGRGYYDRALEGAGVAVVAIGYDDELVDDVPVEPHDQPVSGMLRPSGVTWF